MDSAPPVSPGFIAALGKLGDGLLGGLKSRVELFSVELQEEKFRLIQTFIWISAAVFTGVMAITFASLSLVYLFWESARLGVLLGLTLAYTVALLTLIIAFRRFIARQPKPFAATLAELENDRACIRNPS
jgi:uncharacterized membrane protein YqjE